MRILWLKSELLHPVDKGGKIRSYQMLKRINQEHDVTYMTFVSPKDSPESLRQSAEYCRQLAAIEWSEPRKGGLSFYSDLALNMGSRLPYAIQKYRSTAMRRAIERELTGRNHDLVVCDFLVPSINLALDRRCPALLFQHNVESMIWRRHYEIQTGRLKKAFFRSQWQKMYCYERDVCRRFDAVIAVSPNDCEQMRNEFGLKQVYDVPTGVDTEYFRPLGATRDPFEIVFTGSMDWMPNEDAILYFIEKILPRLASSHPQVTLTVVGRNPGERLKALAESNAQVKVTGRVDDVRPYIDKASAYIVPMRVGGGTRLKIYEAMAMGKPVISTTVGAEGLPVRDGKELLIADQPEDFARAVIGVLDDARLASRLGEQARSLVRARFGWEEVAKAFIDVCEIVVSKQSRKRAA
ncbi:MAG TPA: glycosyltransferase [Blastocatellia bacterium]|nr:glycosyltransferase [Blastocatellia bacterium]